MWYSRTKSCHILVYCEAYKDIEVGAGESLNPIEALAIFGLEPPLTLEDIKIRYKELAKKYHPDLNKGCARSEELLKQVNMSYTVLKLAFQKFDQLEKA